MKMRLLLSTALAVAASSAHAQVSQTAYAGLTGTQFVTFDDVAGGAAPGTNYDGIFFSNGVGFAERFVGQTLSNSGGFDVLDGAPSGGNLTLQTGTPGQNLNIFLNAGTNVLTGLGPAGFPSFDAIGEGSFAALFSSGQSQFGFQLVGGNGGSAFVGFFGQDGSLIDMVTLSGLADAYYGFSRDGGLNDIFGVSIYNNDGAGIGFDNLKFDVRSVGGMVPEPATWALLMLGFGLVGSAMRRKSAVTVRYAW